MQFNSLLGVSVSWQSKSKESVSLSCSEVVYVILSQSVKEVMFVIKLLESMKISVRYPVMVRMDNVVPYIWLVILLPHLILNTWISGTNMLSIMLRMKLLR